MVRATVGEGEALRRGGFLNGPGPERDRRAGDPPCGDIPDIGNIEHDLEFVTLVKEEAPPRDNAQQPELGSEEFPVARKAPTPVSVRHHASVHATVNGIDDLEHRTENGLHVQPGRWVTL
jgi:hypothetical protein